MARLFPRYGDHPDGNLGMVCPVKLHKRPVIHAVDVIAGQDEHIRVLTGHDESQVLANCVCSTSVPVPVFFACLRWKYAYPPHAAHQIPGGTVRNMIHQGKRFVLSQNRYPRKTAVGNIAQREIDDPVNTAEGNCRFCTGLNQYVEPASYSTGEKHRHNLSHFTISPVLYSFRVKCCDSTFG
jgi:hypothetical protein